MDGEQRGSREPKTGDQSKTNIKLHGPCDHSSSLNLNASESSQNRFGSQSASSPKDSLEESFQLQRWLKQKSNEEPWRAPGLTSKTEHAKPT